MLLLILKDGSHIEVTQAVDVIHKLGFLVCVDHLDMPVMTLPVDDVVAYTRNDRLAEEFVSAGPEADASDERQSQTRTKRTRRRSRPSPFENGAPAPLLVDTSETSPVG
jgi:hypothetical protein